MHVGSDGCSTRSPNRFPGDKMHRDRYNSLLHEWDVNQFLLIQFHAWGEMRSWHDPVTENALLGKQHSLYIRD